MELARAAELDPTYISSVERGHRNIGLVNIHVLAMTLGVHVGHLFTCGDT